MLRTITLALVFSLCPPVFGAAPGQGDTPAAATQQKQLGPQHASPRHAMAYFFEQIVPYIRTDGAEGSLRKAGTIFAAGDEDEREALARDLLFLLDHTAEVDVEHEFPGPSGLAGDTSFTWSEAPDGYAELELELRFELRGSGWFLTRPTREEARSLRSAFGRERVPMVAAVAKEGTLTLTDLIRLRVPRGLQDRGFLLEHWQWLGLLVLIFAAVLVDRVTRVIASLIARRLAGGIERVEAGELANFVRPVGLFAGAVVFEAMLFALDLEAAARVPLGLAASFVAAVAGVWAAYRLVDLFCTFLEQKASRTSNKFDDMLVPLLRRTLKVFVVAIGLVYLASRWTDDLWSVVAGLGMGSFALVYAAKDSIENLFGTFTVLMDKPFQLGDWITMGNIDGSVEQVGFRSTRVRTFYNSVITVPNRFFINSEVDNMGAREYRRIKTTLSLTYDTPPEKMEAFCEGVRELIRGHPYTRKDYYHVYFNQWGASSLDVLLYCFVRAPDWATELRERHRLFNDILRLAERLKVSFAFPTQTLHVAKPEDLEHPDRPATAGEGEERGRGLARELLAETLAGYGGVQPEPVVIDPAAGTAWAPPGRERG